MAIVIGTYFITSSFFGVYEMAVDTLFLCFLEGKQGKLVVLQSNFMMYIRIQEAMESSAFPDNL